MSTNETGYARSLANFATLVANCETLGAAYAPSRSALSLASLQDLLEKGRQAMEAHHQAVSTHKHALTEREMGFADFEKKLTRIQSALRASDSPEELDRKAVSVVKKLKGIRIGKKAVPVPATVATGTPGEPPVDPTTHSVSHLSYAARFDGLDQLLKILATTPEYAPNEPDLQTRSLEAWYRQLTTQHSAVVRSAIGVDQARAQREQTLRGDLTGIVDIAQDCKAYLRSAFGTQSPQFQSVSHLQFR